eukprot:6201988-Pleurochrysis_carterae.AAC.2
MHSHMLARPYRIGSRALGVELDSELALLAFPSILTSPTTTTPGNTSDIMPAHCVWPRGGFLLCVSRHTPARFFHRTLSLFACAAHAPTCNLTSSFPSLSSSLATRLGVAGRARSD